MTVFAIARNEVLRLFKSPLAWIGLSVMQFLLARFFFLFLDKFLQPATASLQPGLTETVIVAMLQTCAVLVMIMSPIITMRLFSDEYRSGTIDLLLSAPVSISEIVLGKYLGAMFYMCCIVFTLVVMLLTLNLGTSLDMGLFAAGLLGLFLLIACFVAIGMFMSSLTSQPAIAAMCSFLFTFVLWIIHVAGSSGSAAVAQVLAYMSALKHFNQLLLGLVNSADVIYFLVLSLLFVLLTIWRLDARLLYE